jgi:hypothetical protein
MMHRAVSLTWLTIVLGLAAPPVVAERNMIPSLTIISNVCSGRPNEPDWMQNIALRDAYQRVLVQDIYRAQSMERVVETGSCDCATRFPTWESAESTFRENHGGADRSDMLEASEFYNRRANELRPQAQAICEAAGNW